MTTRTPEIDETFAISHQARAILALVPMYYRKPRPFTYDIQTFPWYNGRERGICFVVGNRGPKSRFIVFGECRNSDSIFVDTWEGVSPFNQPSVEDFSDEAYQGRVCFSPTKTCDAASYVHGLIEDHFDSMDTQCVAET